MKAQLRTYSRDNVSPYLGEFFLNEEEGLFEKELGLKRISPDQPADLLITNTHTRPENLNIEKAQLILHPNSGFDNFSFSWVKKCSPLIVLGNPIRSNAVSETILEIIFRHFSGIQFESTWSKKRIWERRLISSLKILIIGYGHVGQKLEKILNQFSASVEILDPFLNKAPKSSFFEFDVIIPVPGLNKTSYHLIDKSFLSKISKNCVLINVSRGQIIKECDLLEFMSKNEDVTAYLDVFEEEPKDLKYFKSFPNIFTTSHIAGVYKNINSKILEFELQTLKDFQKYEKNDFEKKYDQVILNNFFQNFFLTI